MFCDIIISTGSNTWTQYATDIADSLLEQQDTWGRIQITSSGFKSLMCNLNCFPSFWTLIRGFGLKFEPKDENHIEYKSNFIFRTM